MPRSRAEAGIGQIQRLPEFLDAPSKTSCQADFDEMEAAVRAGFIDDHITAETGFSLDRPQRFCSHSGRPRGRRLGRWLCSSAGRGRD